MNRHACDLCHELETASNLVTRTSNYFRLKAVEEDNGRGCDWKKLGSVDITIRLPDRLTSKDLCARCLGDYIASKCPEVLALLLPYENRVERTRVIVQDRNRRLSSKDTLDCTE